MFYSAPATALAKVQPSTVEDWRKRGTGPAPIRMGTAYFYEFSDVMAFMKSLKKERSREAIYHSI